MSIFIYIQADKQLHELVKAIVNYDQIKLAKMIEKIDLNNTSRDDAIFNDLCNRFWRDDATGMSLLLLSLHCKNFKATQLLLECTSLKSLTDHEKYDIEPSDDGKECCFTFVHALIAINNLQLLKNMFKKYSKSADQQVLIDYLNKRMKCKVHILRRKVFTNDTVLVTCFEYALLKGRIDMAEEFFNNSENFMQKFYKTPEDIKRLINVTTLSHGLSDEIFKKIYSDKDVIDRIFAEQKKFHKFLSKAAQIGNFAFVKRFFAKFNEHEFFKNSVILYDLIDLVFNSSDENIAKEFLKHFIEVHLSSKLPNPLITDDNEKKNIFILAASNGYCEIADYILETLCSKLNVSKSSLEKVFNSSLQHAANSRNIDIIKIIFSQMENMTLCQEFWEKVIIKQNVYEIDAEKFIKNVFSEFKKKQLKTDKRAIVKAAVENENIVALSLILEDEEVYENMELIKSCLRNACDANNAEVVHILLDKVKGKNLLQGDIQPLSDFFQKLVSKEGLAGKERRLLSEISSCLQINMSLNLSDNSDIILLDTVDRHLTSISLETAVPSNESMQSFLKLPASIRCSLTRMLINLNDNISETYNKLLYRFHNEHLKLLNHIILMNEVTCEKNETEYTTPLHLIAEQLDKDMLVLMFRNNADILAVDSNGDTVLHHLAKLSGRNKQYELEYVKIASLILNLYLKSKIPPDYEHADERKHVAFIILTRLIFNKYHMSVISYAVFHNATVFLKFFLNITVERLEKQLDLVDIDLTPMLKEEWPAVVDITGLCEGTMPLMLTNRKSFEALSTVTKCTKIQRNDMNEPIVFISDPPTSLKDVNIKANYSFLDILSDISYKKKDYIDVLQIPVVKKLASHFSRDYRFTMVIVLVYHIFLITSATLLATVDKWPEGTMTGTYRNGTQFSPDECHHNHSTSWIYILFLTFIVLGSIFANVTQLILTVQTIRRNSEMKKVLNRESLKVSIPKKILAISVSFFLQTVPSIIWLCLRLFCLEGQPYVIAIYLFSGWIITILHMKAFKKLHIFISALFSVAKKVFFFFVSVVIFFPIGFGSALIVLLSYPPAIYNMETIGPQIIYLSTRLSFNLGGYFDHDDVVEQEDLRRIIVIQHIYIISVVTTSLFTLNLIIAMMNDRYTKAKTNQKMAWHIRSLRRAHHLRHAQPKWVVDFLSS